MWDLGSVMNLSLHLLADTWRFLTEGTEWHVWMAEVSLIDEVVLKKIYDKYF